MASIRERLVAYTPEQPYIIRKSLSVSEKGKRYSMAFAPERLSAVFQVDGDIIKDGQKCDKLVIFSVDEEFGWTEVFIELKGQDIAHAIDQLSSTLRKDIFKHPTVKKRHARIVGRSIPRSTGNSILDRAKIKFIKEHNCDLRALSHGATEKF